MRRNLTISSSFGCQVLNRIRSLRTGEGVARPLSSPWKARRDSTVLAGRAPGLSGCPPSRYASPSLEGCAERNRAGVTSLRFGSPGTFGIGLAQASGRPVSTRRGGFRRGAARSGENCLADLTLISFFRATPNVLLPVEIAFSWGHKFFFFLAPSPCFPLV